MNHSPLEYFSCVAGMRYQRCQDGLYEAGESDEGQLVVTSDESATYVQYWEDGDDQTLVCEELTEECR